MRTRCSFSTFGCAVLGALLLCPAVFADDPITASDDPALRPGGEGEATSPKVSPPAEAEADVDAAAETQIDAKKNRRQRAAEDKGERKEKRQSKDKKQRKPDQDTQAQDRKKRQQKDRPDADDSAQDATNRKQEETDQDQSGNTAEADVDAQFGFQVNEDQGRVSLQNVERNSAFARGPFDRI